LGPAASQQTTPLAKVHEHLRGRYGVTLVIAAIFAAAGAAAGFILPHPGYQSIGMVEIDPIVKSPELYDKVMPLWQSYIATVVNNFHSERVIKAAMQTPEWKAHRPLPADAYLGEWSKNLVVKLVPQSFVVQVTYTDDHKDGKMVAPIAVAALINTYKEM